MTRTIFGAGVACCVLLAAIACRSRERGSEKWQVAGTVNYLEELPLPSGAELHLTVVDTSWEDVPEAEVAHAMIVPSTQVPIEFALPYEPRLIVDDHTYALQAQITAGGVPWWTTTSSYPVITNGKLADIAVVLTRTGLPDTIQVPMDAAASCGAIARLLDGITGTALSRVNDVVLDEPTGQMRPGCRVHLVGSWAALPEGIDPLEAFRSDLAAQGWTEDLEYSADGPDGTAFVFRSGAVRCAFRGVWDGGDDTNPSDAPSDRWDFLAACSGER